jgi:glycerol kinase
MLMDIKNLEWSPKMLSEYQIKEEWLPKIIKSSNYLFGTI